MMSKMLAYKAGVGKREFVAEVVRHRKADQIIQGSYGQTNGKWRGCAVGCSIHSINAIKGKRYSTSNHGIYETELGIPRIIARLEDRIFEGLSKDVAMLWPERFAKAIPAGADLSLVWPKFVVWLLKDKKDGVFKLARPDGKKAITKVVKLYQQVIDGQEVSSSTWHAADAYAAAAAAYAYAAYAADAYAADAYAADAAAYAARPKHYQKMADKLIELLEEA